jgi:cell division protein FtsQ
MAKRQIAPGPSLWSRVKSVRLYLVPVLSGTLLVLASVLVFQKTESFLIHDQRFVARPGGVDLSITGLSRTPASSVRRVFQQDEGRSVFLVPLSERRRQLLGIQWVREASVSRLWPNRIEIRVSERIPAAFVRLPPARRGGASVPALIDADGVILPAPRDRSNFELPVLAGIREDQSHAERAERVRVMRALLKELDKVAEQVAEVDGADLKNWKLSMQVGDRAVTLILGGDSFGKKVQRFLQHWSDIQRRAPNAYKFDLRLDDRITAVEDLHGEAVPSDVPVERRGDGD